MPFKILYAASNRTGAKSQLCRFLEHMQLADCVIKVAGYKKMCVHIDWTLDALQDIIDKEVVSINNDNFELYLDQIKAFAPNLIISDLEAYSSYIGYVLNIPVWQVSPLLLNIAQPPTREVYTDRNYKTLFGVINQDPLLQNVIFNSDKSFVYSHYCDVGRPPILQDKYEWVRPYHYIGNDSKPCEHKLVAVIQSDINKTINYIEQNDDSIIFIDKSACNLILAKDIYDTKEYACNIKNSLRCINQGSTDILADAFYNQKYSIIFPDMFDQESVMNSMFSEYYGLGYVAYDRQMHNEIKDFNIIHDNSVSFLHEKVFEVI